MNKEIKSIYRLFLVPIQEFLSGELTAPEFNTQYFKVWKKYHDSDELYEINTLSNNSIDRIFTALDCYCEDKKLRDDNDLDEESLKLEVEKIFSELNRVSI